MTTFKDRNNNYRNERDQNTSNEQGDLKDNYYKELISNKLKEYQVGDEQEKFMKFIGENVEPKQETRHVTNEHLASVLSSDDRKEKVADTRNDFQIKGKDTDTDNEDTYELGLRATRNSKSRWENTIVNNERISFLEKQLEAQKLSHDQEIQEITKSFEGINALKVVTCYEQLGI